MATNNRLRSNLYFSPRQIQVLRFKSLGMTDKEVANKMYIGRDAIIKHLQIMRQKGNFESTSELVWWALQNNIIPPLQ